MRHVLAMTKRCSFRDLLNVTGLTVVQFFYVQAISRVSKAWLTTGPMCQRSCRLNISEDNHAPLFTGT